jgi:hypothetical protein
MTRLLEIFQLLIAILFLLLVVRVGIIVTSAPEGRIVGIISNFIRSQ